MDKPHKKLDVWNAGVDLVLVIYQATRRFPKEERFTLTGQLRRAALSLPSNIAEGAARQTGKEFIQYLHVARASLSELDTQVEIAKRLGYLEDKPWTSLDVQMERIDTMLSGLIRHLKTAGHQKQAFSSRALRLTPHA